MRNYIVDRLNSYFRGNYTLNRVPLLIGPSGIAKSALIKQASKDFNMKLVDIRTAFMSRLDIEGLSEKLVSDGKVYSQACPMFDFVRCTDTYIDVCNKFIEEIKKEIETSEYSEELQRTLKRLEEEAKTPILIFDEISRGESSVRQVLTKILTDKEFMNLPMKKARVVAATNSQLDEKGDKVDIYAVNEAYDVAFYDRFESMYISPEVMNPLWMGWAKKNLNKDIYEMVRATSCYDEGHFINKEYREASTTPYKCYRTWEMASKLYNSPIDMSTKRRFIHYINGYGNAQMSMEEFIETSIDTCIPGLVISPSGLGKTSTVMELSRKKNCEVISINLAEVDRLDVEGMPVKINIIKAILGDTKVTKSLLQRFVEIVRGSELPNFCTIRAPKKEYVDKFRKALDTGRKVLIYFDECNRVQNVSVMSAIFSVISDNRMFGISFNPENVVTLLSCNLSDNCSDAQDLDPALCARFAIWNADRYDNHSSLRFKQYATRKGFHEVVISYFNHVGTSSLRDILGSVESRTMEVSAASTRGWEDLSNTLKEGNLPLLKGDVIFTTEEVRRDLSKSFRLDKVSSELANLILNSLKSWSARLYTDDDKDEHGISLKSTVDRLCAVMSKYKNYPGDVICEVIKSIYKLDIEIQEYRENFFRIFLGEESRYFTVFYNTYKKIAELEIAEGMLPKDIEQVVKNILYSVSDDMKCESICKEMCKVPNMTFPDKLAVVVAITDNIDNDMLKAVIKELSTTNEGNNVLRIFEDKNYHIQIARRLGIEINSYIRKVI